MRKQFILNKETHWFYPGQTIYSTGRVMTPCGLMVFVKSEIDYQNPTCEICKSHMLKFNDLADEITELNSN